MTQEEQKKILSNSIKWPEGGYGVDINKTIKSLHGAGYEIAPKSKWIPTETEVPDHYNNVLLSVIDLYGLLHVIMGYYNKDTNSFYHSLFGVKKVVAWQPLPEPYEPVNTPKQ